MRFNKINFRAQTCFLCAAWAVGGLSVHTAWAQYHPADINENHVIERSELVSFMADPAFSEYRQDLETKMLRVVQLFNAGGYLPDPSNNPPAGDGFKPASLKYIVLNLTTNTVDRLEDVPAGGWTDAHKTDKLVLRRIPAGTFIMGSPASELYRNVLDPKAAETQHAVTLTKDYFIGVFQVTQRQWELIMGMGSRPSWFNNNDFYMTRPVEQVGHAQCVSFLAALSAKFADAIELQFTLPTEAQWEYACRAETTTSLNNNTEVTNAGLSGKPCPNLDVVARYLYNPTSNNLNAPRDANLNAGTAAVGSYASNDWGLYDMHGNVQERCLDFIGAYPSGAEKNPTGATSGERVLRGGAWDLNVGTTRSAARRTESSNGSKTRNIGLRVCAPMP